jgi:gluconate 5-dehydrogenase
MTLKAFDLTGRTALVTGSTSGIGLSIARGLARSGARVFLHGRDQAKIEAARTDLSAEGLATEEVRFDVTDQGEVEAGIATVERTAPIDILVNNAGMQHRGLLAEFDLAMWNRVLATNLTSAFLVGRTVARGMAMRRRGKIVNVCSLMSEVGRKTIGPYTAAKGGLKQLTRAMAIEWAEHNIQVNGLGPGYFATPLNAALVANPEFDGWLRRRTPAGRWGDVEELVAPAVFLASDATSFMTGQILYIDGGILASI